MTKIRWTWQRCGNLFITILGIIAITLFAFVLLDLVVDYILTIYLGFGVH